jgi:hypothetical protein
MSKQQEAAERDTIALPRALIERALTEHVEPVIDCYSPDCGDPGCEDCTRVLRPAILLRDALRAALAAEQPQPVAWAVAFNGRADIDYAYRFRDGAESAADYLRAHKAEFGPFTVVPLYAAPPPPAPAPTDAITDAVMTLVSDKFKARAFMSRDEMRDAIDAALAARDGK